MFAGLYESDLLCRKGVWDENSGKQIELWGVDQECAATPADGGLYGFGMGFFEDSVSDSGLPMLPRSCMDQNVPPWNEFGGVSDMDLDFASPQNLSSVKDFRDDPSNEILQRRQMIEPKKKRQVLSTADAFGLLKKYGRSCRTLNGKRLSDGEPVKTNGSTPLSTQTIVQLAAQKFIQSTSLNGGDEVSALGHPYPTSVLCSSMEDRKEVELVQNLLTCAEKIGKKQYEGARWILQECDKMGSITGSTVRRLVFYFTEALHQKIDKETANRSPNGSIWKKVEDPIEALSVPHSTLIALHSELPLAQINKFASVQAILDGVAKRSSIHVIDFEIRTGMQYAIMMQALAGRSEHPLEQMKITAVGTRSRETLEETGRQLTVFAQSLNLKLSYEVIMVADMLDLHESMFKLDACEGVAVYAAYTLTTMIGLPNRLEHLMHVIRAVKPCVMVVSEPEVNCNSPVFVDRFVEALFFYAAYFDSISECMKNDEKNRILAESICFRTSIRNIIASEGDERKIRHVSIGVWRAFFESFGFEETQLSMSSMYQANLVVKKFPTGNSFTFDTDGEVLIIGWKGTPLSSLSAWRIHDKAT